MAPRGGHSAVPRHAAVRSPVSVPIRVPVGMSSLPCFRSASYSSRLAHLSLASEFALLMADGIKGESMPDLSDRPHDCPDNIPCEMTHVFSVILESRPLRHYAASRQCRIHVAGDIRHARRRFHRRVPRGTDERASAVNVRANAGSRNKKACTVRSRTHGRQNSEEYRGAASSKGQSIT